MEATSPPYSCFFSSSFRSTLRNFLPTHTRTHASYLYQSCAGDDYYLPISIAWSRALRESSTTGLAGAAVAGWTLGGGGGGGPAFIGGIGGGGAPGGGGGGGATGPGGGGGGAICNT